MIRQRNRYQKHRCSHHYYGVIWLLLASISVAMDQPYCKSFPGLLLNLITQKFGATVFTQGLQHAMKLPYQEFEDATKRRNIKHIAESKN